MWCSSRFDGYECVLPVHGPLVRHRVEVPSTHPTYRSTHVVTWRTGCLPLSDDRADHTGPFAFYRPGPLQCVACNSQIEALP
jgi:hypothetical protein